MKKTATRLILIAVAVGVTVVAYDRLRPSKESTSKEPQKVAAIAPAPVAEPAASSASPPAEVASAPTPPPRPAHMSASEEAGFDAWVIKAYLTCWKPAAPPADADPYVALVRVAFKPDGSLSKAKLVNPPSNPALKSQAKSVLAAVQACNPLQVPAQYRPFYDQWKTKTISFDPEVAAR
jgi:hypothetical protein